MGEFKQVQVLRIAMVASLFFLVVNHLLPPKAYSATQLLIDYEFGLVRRGLVGEMLTWVLGPSVSNGEVLAASAAITLLGLFAFWIFALRLAGGARHGLLLLILALNSFAMASFIGNTGYLDSVLLALALGGLAIDPQTRAGVLARIVFCGVGILVHENMLPYFALILSFDLWLSRDRIPGNLFPALLPVVAGFGVLAGLMLFAGVTEEQLTEFVAYIDQRAEFSFEQSSAEIVGKSISDNLLLMSELRGTVKYWAWVLFDGLPLAAMSLWLIWLSQKMLGEEADKVTRIFLILAILGPLSLNMVAFDVVRFGAVSVICGFVAVLLILQRVEGAEERLKEILTWPHFLLVLILNANIFTIQVNVGAGHMSQFPWVLLTQLKWVQP